ncbi:hypothetical protein [Paracoccus siganidrum]|nr:hypothetical protein [Paracoccus siganidrum]RMC40459.1 hypothetical protein C9E82_02035 [Paracoccus siganidrum]
MADIPTIFHAVTEPAARGFAAQPARNTPDGHAAFQQAVQDFAGSQLEWELLVTHPGRYGQWDAAIFVPATGA